MYASVLYVNTNNNDNPLFEHKKRSVSQFKNIYCNINVGLHLNIF